MNRQERLRRVALAHDRRRRGRPMRVWRRFAVTLLYPRTDRGFWYGFAIDLLWPVLMAVARWDFRGGADIPRRGGALLAVNHLSHIDPIVIVAYTLSRGRVPRFMAMSELWDMTVVGAPLRGGRHIPVDRTSTGIEAYRAAVDAVTQGEIVAVYPEGGFADHSDGWPREARTGITRIALETGAPVIPIAQWGSNHLLPPATNRPVLWPRATLRVLAGAPVALDDLREGRIKRSDLHTATDRIMGRITEQLAELRGEQPPPRADAPAPDDEHRAASTGGTDATTDATADTERADTTPSADRPAG